jgi:hypothetical protein
MEAPMAKGLDVGTSYIVMANHLNKDDTFTAMNYVDFRDAFYIVRPTSAIAKNMMEKGLAGKVFVKDTDDSFILLGQDAIDKALERNESASRPMFRGIISPKEKNAKKVLAFIIGQAVGQASEKGEKIVFSVPAQPIDQEDDDFDVGYHEDVINTILTKLGYESKAINEAEALCYSELSECNYTGIGLSWGAGMVNVCIMLNGEPISVFSTTKSGDWIDRMAASATGETDTVIQYEKENGSFVIGEPNDSPILSAVSAYYQRLIDYTTKYLEVAISEHKLLSKFKDPLNIVVGGGTTQAQGFVEEFEKKLKENNFPLKIKAVSKAKDPLHAVARGCYIAAKIL